MHSNTHSNRFILKIEDKSKQLQENGLSRSDQELLKDHRRLEAVWGESARQPDGDNSAATTWRKDRARRVYREVQDADHHLFLAFVLAIPPTECCKKSFNETMEYLDRLDNYEPYRLELQPVAKRFFDSTAASQGFASSRRYIEFIQAVFPQSTGSVNSAPLASWEAPWEAETAAGQGPLGMLC